MQWDSLQPIHWELAISHSHPWTCPLLANAHGFRRASAWVVLPPLHCPWISSSSSVAPCSLDEQAHSGTDPPQLRHIHEMPPESLRSPKLSLDVGSPPTPLCLPSSATGPLSSWNSIVSSWHLCASFSALSSVVASWRWAAEEGSKDRKAMPQLSHQGRSFPDRQKLGVGLLEIECPNQAKSLARTSPILGHMPLWSPCKTRCRSRSTSRWGSSAGSAWVVASGDPPHNSQPPQWSWTQPVIFSFALLWALLRRRSRLQRPKWPHAP